MMDELSLLKSLRKALQIEFLANEIKELRAKVNQLELNGATNLPAWCSLREACEAAGLSYETMRRPENIHKRPNSGMPDAIINGTRKYSRKSVICWIQNLGKHWPQQKAQTGTGSLQKMMECNRPRRDGGTS